MTPLAEFRSDEFGHHISSVQYVQLSAPFFSISFRATAFSEVCTACVSNSSGSGSFLPDLGPCALDGAVHRLLADYHLDTLQLSVHRILSFYFLAYVL